MDYVQVRLMLPYLTLQQKWHAIEQTQKKLTPQNGSVCSKPLAPLRPATRNDDLERFLDLLYGMFSAVSILSELHQIVVSDPFDSAEHRRQLKLVDLTGWLEALIA